MNEQYISLDIGGTNIKSALIEKDGTVVHHNNVPNEVGKKACQRIMDEIHRLMRHARKTEDGIIRGIGLASPGRIDEQNGVIIRAPNLQWNNVPLASIVKEEWNMPVSVLNDTNAAAIGEYTYGAHHSSHLVCITLGTGIGAGIVIDGALYKGHSGLAGELGHIVMNPSGPPCPCGKNGCLEAIASAPAMVKRFLSRSKQRDEDDIQLEQIVGLAKSGDPTAQTVLNETAETFGLAVANVSNMLDIRTFVLAGGVMKMDWPLRDAISRAANANSLSTVHIHTSTLIDYSAILGAITPLLTSE